MSIKRFFAKTTRDALHMVRDALGPDGAIISNRAVDGGIEILAMGPDDITALMPPSVADGIEGASTPGNGAREVELLSEPLIEPLNQARDMDPAVTGKFAERGVPTDAGVKDLPRLHFPVFDGNQEQQAERWIIPDLSAESRQTKSRTLSGVHEAKAKPDFVNGDDHGQSTIGSRSWADTSMERIVGRITGGRELEDLPAPESGTPRKKRRAAINPREKSSPGTQVTRATRAAPVPAKKTSPVFDPRQIADEVAASVLSEIQSMRGTLEQQLAALSWNEQQRRYPIRGQVLRQLLAAGFSASLAHDLLDRLPVGQLTGQPTEQFAEPTTGQEGQRTEKREKDAMNWVKTVLAGNLPTIGNENEMLEKGGVYALVGPTGVGKTTTTAKLAARCVVRHGSDKLALLTTDGYRIGGHEQLRIYGKILGVSVYAVKDAQDLTLALAELRGKHMVLIDTVGMGQRDKMVTEQVAMLAGCGTGIKRLLLLNAASSGDTLNEVVHAYQGDGLAGAIITKLDEAVTTGCVLDTAIRHQLPLYYVATGQRVPEDLHLADSAHLVDSAFNNLPVASPFAVPEDALPMLMAGVKRGMANPDSNGAYFG
ncbi:flagellar biosynthesis protein FlhF [Nitrosospira sp. Nsp13]|uniref:flagellar biosynthesis protein FlhF n=1 Tax=Nitrosospira sp. Nsp13 TaxID=1855332 RepID=UPI00087FFBC6|nr:flagellar biosynthesis protein FlhF [Nitrosospira sp. Nsp13]SCX78260.1 flagellar biosynthesis protein FlhF [Nitrosospira sp. Nsp13]